MAGKPKKPKNVEVVEVEQKVSSIPEEFKKLAIKVHLDSVNSFGQKIKVTTTLFYDGEVLSTSDDWITVEQPDKD